MRVLITVEYFGKNYAGWQSQKNAVSVQNVIEDALLKTLGVVTKIFGSGRTDSGVHALNQKAHFDIEEEFDLKKLPLAINTHLPPDIRIKKAERVGDDFHAQYMAKSKTYVYKMYINRTLSPLRKDTHAQIPYDEDRLDYNIMVEGVKHLIGTHDFVGFSSTGSGVNSTVRTIYDANLVKDGDNITLTITGNGFLYNMVRIIAGTLVFMGLGKLPKDAINQVFSTLDRKKGGKTFPPCGLYLFDVRY